MVVECRGPIVVLDDHVVTSLGHLAFEVSFIRLKDDAREDRRPDGHVEVAAELLHAVVPATAQGLAVSMRHEVGRANRVGQHICGRFHRLRAQGSAVYRCPCWRPLGFAVVLRKVMGCEGQAVDPVVTGSQA